MASRSFKRKKYFIAAKFQAKYIAYILLFLYVGAAIAGYTVYYTTWVTLGEKLANVYPRGRLIYIFHDANMALLLRIILITPLFVWIGVILSHRIAGPVYRIGKYLDTLIQGDYSQCLTLRKKDELKSIAEKLSQLCVKLSDEKKKHDEAVEAAIEILKKRNIGQDVIEGLRTKLKEQ